LTTRICKEASIEGQFAVIYPIVKKYLSARFFGGKVDLEHESIRRKLCDSKIAGKIISILAKEIGEVIIRQNHIRSSLLNI